MIEAKQLRKVFGPIEAVRGVSFRVEQGEVLGFLGPNGAGKSTVMRMLTCFLTPTSGTATVGGHDILDAPLEVRQLVGYLPESNPVYGDMTALSFLRFIGNMRGYDGKELTRRVDEVLDTCRIADVRRQSLETLSKGYKRRVGLAQALLHDPKVLILDEPTDGLDPNQKQEVRELIEHMARDKCIVVSTHILEEVDAVCTRAIIIDKGDIVADDTPANLRARSDSYGAVHLGLRGAGASAEAFKALEGVREVRAEDGSDSLTRVTVLPEPGQAIAQRVIDLVRERGWEMAEIDLDQGRLDEVFRAITQGDRAA